jgi:hypothetical protein
MTGEKQTQWFLTFNRCRHHQLSSLVRELSWISLPHAVKLGSAMSDTDRDADENGAYWEGSQRDEIVAYWRMEPD